MADPGGAAGAPQRDPILSFLDTFSPKSAHVGGRCPPPPAQREIRQGGSSKTKEFVVHNGSKRTKEDRRREKIWRKYKEEHQFKALIREQRKYRTMLQDQRRKVVSDKVMEYKGNIKELYKLINNLTGCATENPLPSNDEGMAEELAVFFLDKIQKIREALDHHDKFDPTIGIKSKVVSVDNFELYSEEEIRKIVMTLSTKTCESDVIPTGPLKKILPSVLRIITNIMNTSLKEGVLHLSGK